MTGVLLSDAKNRIQGQEELRMVLEETISMLEVTATGLRRQLGAGNEQLENARKMVAAKLCVISFFDNLSQGRTADAFLEVSDDIKWWAPGGKMLDVDKKHMIMRMAKSKKLAFVIKELVVGKSCIAVSVSAATKSYQFLFLFCGDQIVGVKEKSDARPLMELLTE